MNSALEQTCQWLVQLINARAAKGDPVARGFQRGLHSVAYPPPHLAMVRQWLGNVAGEVRIIRPDADHAIATRIQAGLRAADAQRAGSAEQAWRDLVTRSRTMGPPPPRQGPPPRY